MPGLRSSDVGQVGSQRGQDRGKYASGDVSCAGCRNPSSKAQVVSSQLQIPDMVEASRRPYIEVSGLIIARRCVCRCSRHFRIILGLRVMAVNSASGMFLMRLR